jgi:hypothetical protein
VAARGVRPDKAPKIVEGTSMAEPAGTPAPAAAPPAANPPAFAAFDQASRMIIIGAAILVVALLLGLALGAWQLNPFGLVLVLAALVAAGATWAGEAMTVPEATKSSFPVAQLAAGAIATALSILAVAEMLGDIDDMEDFGGPVGFLLGIVILAASIAVLWGAMRRTAPDLRGAERGAMLAMVGAGLVLLAWILHLTIGFWALGPASWGLAAVVLAAVLLLMGSESRLPAWVGWVAAALGLFAAWTAFGQWGALMEIGEERITLGLEDYLPFLIYVAGILLVIGGALLTAVGNTPAASAALSGVMGRDANTPSEAPGSDPGDLASAAPAPPPDPSMDVNDPNDPNDPNVA